MKMIIINIIIIGYYY